MRKIGRKVVLLAAAGGLAAAAAGIPAGAANGAAAGSHDGISPPGGGSTYSVVVQGDVHISGPDVNGGGISEYYQPPPCWLQPYYHQPQSYLGGDPQPVAPPQDSDSADSFWWSMADLYPNLIGFINRSNPGGGESWRELINEDFEDEQNGQQPPPGTGSVGSDWVWWAPNWLSGSAGWACAQGLVGSADMNNGFLDLEPPATPGAGGPGGAITGENLAAIARAALSLPTISIVTRPGGTSDMTSAYVNEPTSLYLAFNPREDPTDTATVYFVGGGRFLSATISTQVTSMQITATDGKVTYNAAGTCTRAAPCTVKFSAPSATNDPFTISAYVAWSVTWKTSTGQAGTFTTPPTNETQTRPIVVREIQSVNG
jgi:hypothetical protein